MKRILFSIVIYVLLIPVIFAEAGISDKNAELIQAATNGNLTDVQTALANGADINATGSAKYKEAYLKGVTALMAATFDGNTEIVKLLSDKGADLNVKRSPDGMTALLLASIYGHTEIVKILLSKGANVNIKTTTGGQTALWFASAQGHTEIVKILLSKGADVNLKTTTDGTTAFDIASSKGHVEIVKILLSKSANVKK